MPKLRLLFSVLFILVFCQTAMAAEEVDRQINVLKTDSSGSIHVAVLNPGPSATHCSWSVMALPSPSSEAAKKMYSMLLAAKAGQLAVDIDFNQSNCVINSVQLR